jgi:two-component system sensor histidine kinase/response regulator
VSLASRNGRSLTPRSKRGDARPLPQFAARVLVVEDNAVNQEVASGFLESIGCRVVTASNGRVALRLCTQETFDLILMDCEMPLMDGLEATRRIREMEAMAAGLPGATPKRTPIVAVTAHALGEVRDRCLQAGMDDFLVKPFDDRQVAEALQRWLPPVDAAAASGPPREALIDQEVIENIRALDRKLGSARLQRAVTQFVEIAGPLATVIQDAAREGDTDALWRAAHSLKSSAGALGARQLAQRCGEIETTARAKRLEPARALVAGLGEDLTQALRALTSLVGQGDEALHAK